MIEGLPQYGGAPSTAFYEFLSRRFRGDTVKDVLQRQVFVPTLLELLHGKAQSLLQVLPYHAPTSSSVQRRG